MTVQNDNGEIFVLSDNEEKFLKAIMRLNKMHQGRLNLFGNGFMSVRFGGISAYRTVYRTTIQCEGGDGGDNFD